MRQRLELVWNTKISGTNVETCEMPDGRKMSNRGSSSSSYTSHTKYEQKPGMNTTKAEECDTLLWQGDASVDVAYNKKCSQPDDKEQEEQQ